jgi:hypothetical protein
MLSDLLPLSLYFEYVFSSPVCVGIPCGRDLGYSSLLYGVISTKSGAFKLLPPHIIKASGFLSWWWFGTF